MDERRRASRYALWFPMRIEEGGDVILGISRDISELGVAFVAAAAPDVGAKVRVKLMLPGDEERTILGAIVRVEPNEKDQEGLWQHRVAVAFDEQVKALEPVLEEVARSSQPPPEP